MAQKLELTHLQVPGPYYDVEARVSRQPMPWAGYKKVDENIAANQADVASAMKGWMDSPEDKAKLLSTIFQDVGFCNCKSATGALYWAQVFGDPYPLGI
jgi:uncharacterized protein YkwD